jgi:hypothetical protein
VVHADLGHGVGALFDTHADERRATTREQRRIVRERDGDRAGLGARARDGREDDGAGVGIGQAEVRDRAR